MTLNLTIGHFAGFCVMALVASAALTGMQLIRAIGFIALWQLLTPVRHPVTDTLLMMCAWSATEVLYLLAARWAR
jgi:hypothetical protein